MKLTKKQIKDYEAQGFEVRRTKDVIKELEAIPQEELLYGQRLCLEMLYSEDPKGYSLERGIKFDKILSHYLDPTKYIKVCPNDNTKLPPSKVDGFKSGIGYYEYTMCPRCKCLIERRPSDKAIKKYESMPPIVVGSDISQIVDSLISNTR